MLIITYSILVKFTQTANIETPTDQSHPNFSRNDPNKEHESFDNDFEIVSEHNQAALHLTLVSSVTMLIDNREQNSELSNIASDSLLEYLPKPASIVYESILCSNGTTEKLPNIKLVDKTKINTNLGGSKSVIQNAPNVGVNKMSMPETNFHPVHVVLLQIEKVTGTRKYLYINRLIEGYDVPV